MNRKRIRFFNEDTLCIARAMATLAQLDTAVSTSTSRMKVVKPAAMPAKNTPHGPQPLRRFGVVKKR